MFEVMEIWPGMSLFDFAITALFWGLYVSLFVYMFYVYWRARA